MATGFQEKVVVQPAAGDVLMTVAISLTDPEIEAMLDILAVSYPSAATVGYNLLDNTFFNFLYNRRQTCLVEHGMKKQMFLMFGVGFAAATLAIWMYRNGTREDRDPFYWYAKLTRNRRLDVE
jgi:hypothetical protein